VKHETAKIPQAGKNPALGHYLFPDVRNMSQMPYMEFKSEIGARAWTRAIAFDTAHLRAF